MDKDDHESELTQLRRRLAVLTEEARKNDEAWRRAQAREMELLEADTLDALLERLTAGMRASYRLETATLVIADPDHEISQVEIFGPAVVVMKFHDEDEAVAIANNSEYGLAAYIQSNDLQRVHRLSERLNAGGVYNNGGFQINPHTPFGGIGISGFGKEGGKAGIDSFTELRWITIETQGGHYPI